ncbi:DUF4293 domain-containing protein [Panacibacter sp. DH6]|uniref:DUF4293 domain-containing protein n=1 Tax=Panacibacter microcysteis TaxID=2793269 RepID=A0A931E4K8_9BACT|nr:DUF4293 domain-containing protein [Panacibacter microcysteis]MBG9374888.1 DUF4293 domain-containing protein [Panacibacter microcysteis]
MIQRIQSIWLLLASVCSFLTLKLSFFSGNKLENNIKTFQSLTAQDNMLLMVLTVAVAIAALVTIFLYKDRKMQMKVSFAVLVLAIVNIVLFFSATAKFVEGKHDWSSPLVFLPPVFILLAIRGIYKDEKLVKSVDRLR